MINLSPDEAVVCGAKVLPPRCGLFGDFGRGLSEDDSKTAVVHESDRYKR